MGNQTKERPPGALVPGKAFIHDGYTFRGYIAERRGLHPALRFDWRPVRREQIVEAYRRLSDAGSVQAERATCAMVAKHVIWWDAKDLDGNPMPITADNLFKHFPDPFRERLMEILRCNQASDWDPEWDEADALEPNFNLEKDAKN